MFGQTFYRCPGCGTDIRHELEDGEELACVSCRRRFRVMVDRESEKVGLVEILERGVRSLDESERESRRRDAFAEWLDQVREEGNIENRWEASMIPAKM